MTQPSGKRYRGKIKFNFPVTQALADCLKEVNAIASSAMRFAASQKGVVRVLSGMNDMEQVLDNCKTFRDFKALTAQEAAVIQEVTKIIESNTSESGRGEI